MSERECGGESVAETTENPGKGNTRSCSAGFKQSIFSQAIVRAANIMSDQG